jgi:hypothetical protein
MRGSDNGMAMTNQIRAVRLAVGFALVAMLTGAPASPARADEHGRAGWQGRERDEGQEPRRDGWREHGHDKRPEHDRYNNYGQRPDIYYSAPPVIVAPRGYYTQPGATLNFNLPFFR